MLVADCKTFAARLALAVLASLLFGGSEALTRAQSNGNDDRQASLPAQGEVVQPEDNGRPHPRRRARDGARLLERLNLSPEQRAQIRAISQQMEADGRPLLISMRRARRALDEAIYSEADDEAVVEERAREFAAAQAAVARLRALTELKIRRVLTPEQFAILRDLRQNARRSQLRRRRGAGDASPAPRDAHDTRQLRQPDPAPAGESVSPVPSFIPRERRRRAPRRAPRP